MKTASSDKFSEYGIFGYSLCINSQEIIQKLKNRIPSTDGRIIRRMVRDAKNRGITGKTTLDMWDSVRRGEEKNIFPFQEQADVMFNSALIYELAVLKQLAEPILFGIERDSKEYLEAKRLLKFLDYFLVPLFFASLTILLIILPSVEGIRLCSSTFSCVKALI